MGPLNGRFVRHAHERTASIHHLDDSLMTTR